MDKKDHLLSRPHKNGENKKGGLCMKGGIYKNAYGGWQVRFGKEITRQFKNYSDAERCLTGLRFKTDEGSFDIRDYQKGRPLGFATQAKKFLDFKKRQVSPGYFKNINNYMNQAIDEWGQTNIKDIKYGKIEDFLFKRKDISEKTRANMKSCLHTFFKWVSKREEIPMPELPEIKFDRILRNIIDIETQQQILAEIKRISYHINPKIWLGVKFLCTYIALRPTELLRVKEKEIKLNEGYIIIPHPKEKRPKIIDLLDEDIELLRFFPPGLPDLYFFRHEKGISGCKAGQRFGKKYFYKSWIRACKNLGVEGIDLYGGTRHTTITALGMICTPEEVKDASGHASIKAFEHYFQNRRARRLEVTKKINKLSINNLRGSDNHKILKLHD